MSFLKSNQIEEIKSKLVFDESELKKIYKLKKNKFQYISIVHSRVNEFLKKHWVIDKEYKTKTRMKIPKTHNTQFEDDVWCQFYELGFKILNRDENFILPFSKNPEDKKQIDIIAVNNECVFLIECKSSKKAKKAPSFKDEFDLLSLRIDGFRKAISQLFNTNLKTKFIFSTRNIRLDSESEDMHRLKKVKGFYYNDNTYDYIQSLIKHYKEASLYQFLGLVFKEEFINSDKIEIPAVEGWMGKKEILYVFD